MPGPSAARSCTHAVTRGALVPLRGLEAVEGAAPGTWLALDADPQFSLPHALPAGWVRVRLRLTSTVPGRLELYADSGEGFPVDSCLVRAEVRGRLDGEFFVRLPQPARALRLDPLDAPGRFQLSLFRIEHLSAIQLFGQSVRTKLRQLHAQARTPGGVWSGLRLLLGGRFGELRRKAMQGLDRPFSPMPLRQDADEAYAAWRRQRQLTDEDRERIRRWIAEFAVRPRFTLVVRQQEASDADLARTLTSIGRQLYPACETRISDDHLIDLAGDYFAVVRAGDELSEHALFRVAKTLAADPRLDMVYSDEDRVDADGRHSAAFFKPGWSPETFLAHPYSLRLAVYRTALVRETGSLQPGPAADLELALRLLERGARVGRIADVLYHAAERPIRATEEQRSRQVLASHLAATGRPARVDPGPAPGLHQVRFTLQGRPRVSILLPSACRPINLRGEQTFWALACARSIRQRSTYTNYEIVLLHNAELPAILAQRLAGLEVRTLPCPGPFNWSAVMNRGAAVATGDHLLFLNDDMEVISPDWIEALLEWSQQPAIGAVGGRLLFPDGRIQHAGVVLLDGIPRHVFRLWPGDHPGYFHNTLVPRNCSAVTGACLMTRTEVFRQLGGFDERFALNYNDVDYCLRLHQAGWRTVYTPHAELYHHESATQAGVAQDEIDAYMERWGRHWKLDPYYNPNLSVKSVDYHIETDLATAESCK